MLHLLISSFLLLFCCCCCCEGDEGGVGWVGVAGRIWVLVETAAPQVVSNDDVGNSVEHELHVLCVCGTGHVCVDLFCLALVHALKLGLDVAGRLCEGVGASVLWESDGQGRLFDLLLEEILLVQE